MIRFFASRLRMKHMLASACKKKEMKIHFRNGAALFSRIRGGKNDFFVETENTIYSVKLVGFLSRRKSLCLIDDTHYAVKTYGGMRFLPHVAFDGAYVTKEKPKCDFFAYLPHTSKDVKCIYLMNPNPWIKVSTIEGNAMREIASGDACKEAYFYTLSGFLKDIIEC